MSDDSERRLEKYARKVATALHARGEPTRAPRPSSTTTEVVSEGFLGFGRRTVEHQDDGGSPRFWVIGARRESGEWAVYHPRPGSQVREHGWMAGNAAILLENGDLGYGYWREDPFGSYWVISDITELSVSGMTILDYADKGRWEKARSSGREQYREEFKRHYVPNIPAGIGFSLSLKRLLEGTGIPMHGGVTGMREVPRGPQ
jgi:hypothetical protein